MKLGKVLIIVSILIQPSLQYDDRRQTENKPCQTKDGIHGICKKTRKCLTAAVAVRRGIYPAICGFNDKEAIICCPPESLFAFKQPLQGQQNPIKDKPHINVNHNKPVIQVTRMKLSQTHLQPNQKTTNRPEAQVVKNQSELSEITSPKLQIQTNSTEAALETTEKSTKTNTEPSNVSVNKESIVSSENEIGTDQNRNTSTTIESELVTYKPCQNKRSFKEICKIISKCTSKDEENRDRMVCSLVVKNNVTCCPTISKMDKDQLSSSYNVTGPVVSEDVVLSVIPIKHFLEQGEPDGNVIRKDNKTQPSNETSIDLKKYSHLAMIGYGGTNQEWLCGGSLISDKFVISAAHCAKPKGKGPAHWVKLGSSSTNNQQIIKIVRRIKYPDYNKYTQYYDLALFEMDRKINFNNFIRPVCMEATAPVTSAERKNFLTVGYTLSADREHLDENLVELKLQLVPTSYCDSKLSNSIGRFIPSGIKVKTQICAIDENEEGVCPSNSGGPLLRIQDSSTCMYNLVGVKSFDKGCKDGYPGVFTRISALLPWIKEIIRPQNRSNIKYIN